MIEKSRLPPAARLLCLLPVMLAGAAASASEREISLPVRLDNAYLREAFVSQAFKQPGPSARVWDDGTGCNYMVISDPAVATRVAGDDRHLDITTNSDARIGQRAGDRCIVVLDWSGSITTTQTVEPAAGDNIVRFRVVDSRISNEEVRYGLRVGTLWDWVKQHVHPRLATVRIDLQPALTDLRSVLQLMFPDQGDTALSETLDSIKLDSVEVVEDGLVAHLGMTVPAGFFQPQSPAPALSAAELARFESAWQGWDGFVTFVVKYFAASAATPEVRRDLLDVLIQARYDVIEILGTDTEVRGRDPVRELFVETWSRLAPILRRLSAEVPGERALNLLSFIAAADALQTLDALGPQLNLDISMAGLRRMARILVPEPESDPLNYDQAVDPDLRRLFDFGPVPRRRDTAPPPESRWRGLLPHLFPDARAAAVLDDQEAARLNGWIPERSELDAYLAAVRHLLNETGHEVAAGSELDPDLHELFRVLILATAWQETCWRQYQRTGGEVVPIRSPAGAVGLMQVVPTVWRGFYEAQGLTRDIVYNAAAGSEILMHYLVHYAIARGEHRQPGGRDNLAWATYAAYNGGPRHLRRYRTTDTRESLRSIDLAFREKFKTIRDGDELAVRVCYAG